MRTPPLNVLVAARNAGRQTGILPSVQLAQWALESAWGAKATGKFNFFGVKAAKGDAFTVCWTHEEVGGHLLPCQADFKNYADLDDAFLEHAQLLTTGYFAAAAPLRASYPAFVKAIAPHYATDHAYADKLIELIREEHFDQYDPAPKGAS